METIRTIEELSDLPVGSVILSQIMQYGSMTIRPFVAIREQSASNDNHWTLAGSEIRWSQQEMEWFLPAILLWNPNSNVNEL